MPNSARTGECANHSRRRKLAMRRTCPITTAQTRIPRGNVGVDPTVARSLEVGLQAQAVTGVVLDLANVRPLQRGCCLRRSTSNSALAVRTSRRAS
jgi:hypothetical protein